MVGFLYHVSGFLYHMSGFLCHGWVVSCVMDGWFLVSVEVIKSVVTQTPYCEIKRVFLNRLTNSRHLHTAEEQNRKINKQF